MKLINKTVEQIGNEFEASYPNIAEQPTFVKKAEKDEFTIVRMWYKEEIYIQRGYWDDGYYKVKDFVFWLIIKDGKVHLWKHTLKSAKGYLGIYPKRKPRIVRDEAAVEYAKSIKEDPLYKQDVGNCVPTAVANALKIPYAEARTMCMEYGFKPTGGGMYRGRYTQMLKDKGIKFENRTDFVKSKVKTTKMFERFGFEGTWIISVSGHALAAVNGVIVDYAGGRNYRIENALQII